MALFRCASGGGGQQDHQVLFDEHWAGTWSSDKATKEETATVSGTCKVCYSTWASSATKVYKNNVEQTATFSSTRNYGFYTYHEFSVETGDVIKRTIASSGGSTINGLAVIIPS